MKTLAILLALLTTTLGVAQSTATLTGKVPSYAGGTFTINSSSIAGFTPVSGTFDSTGIMSSMSVQSGATFGIAVTSVSPKTSFAFSITIPPGLTAYDITQQLAYGAISSASFPVWHSTGDPTGNTAFPCDPPHDSFLYLRDNPVLPASKIWYCNGATSTWTNFPPIGSPFQSQDFSLQPGLFATAAVKSNVYFEPYALTIMAVTTRIEGSPICTAAPTIVILDLGTSPTTAYASATILYSQATATSNTVIGNSGLGIAVPAGHYLGIGLSAGTCVTAPTISTVVTLQ